MGRTKQSSSSSFWSSRRRASSAPATPRPEPASSDPPFGCMSMVHYLIFAPGAGCVGRPPASSNAVVTPHGGDHLLSPRRDGDSRSSSSKSGFEAPRNSLDLDADNPNDIQIGVQIEPVFDALARNNGMRRGRPTAASSEAETPRTPSLVARLMGIDGLPDNQPSPSPAANHRTKLSSSSSKQKHAAAAADKENYYHCSAPAPSFSGKGGEKKKRVIPESMNRREPLRSLSCNVGEARSLPETPRGSTTSARASWDGPRLSLQALKETVLDRAAHYMSMPSSPTSSSAAGKKKNKDGARRRRDEKERERAAKEHARQILRQAKENVATRKAAAAAEKKRSSFISSSNKENVPASTAQHYPQLEDKPMVATAFTPKAQEHPPPSPRVPLAPRQPPPPHRAKPSRPPPPPPPLDPPTRAKKPDGCERFATRIKKPSPAAASAVAAAGGQHPPPASSSAPAASSASASVVGKQQGHAPLPPLEEDPEYVYLRAVLERGGFMRSPPPPLSRRSFLKQGHSAAAAAPVDPIVFHLLELELPADGEARLGPLRHRWNRKLLFHLAQELLGDLLLLPQPLPAPASVLSGGATERPAALPLTGPPLLGKVWRKVRGFPAADCRVVGDIDALVARDLEDSSSSSPAAARRLARHPAVAEEAWDVAAEVAERVLDALLAESVSHLSASSCA
ncbi:unnamed protein product [Urochloa decumbens]|uniref:DUF4378 domain-containing protein n=1 Tax=Urochloa decumbens TaxID=240449 RepID=A0ABC9DA59_9POAL